MKNPHEKWNIVVFFLLSSNENDIDMVLLKQNRGEHKEEDVIVRFWNESFIEFSVDVFRCFRCEVFYEKYIASSALLSRWWYDDDGTYFLGNFLGIYFNLQSSATLLCDLSALDVKKDYHVESKTVTKRRSN